MWSKLFLLSLCVGACFAATLFNAEKPGGNEDLQAAESRARQFGHGGYGGLPFGGGFGGYGGYPTGGFAGYGGYGFGQQQHHGGYGISYPVGGGYGFGHPQPHRG